MLTYNVISTFDASVVYFEIFFQTIELSILYVMIIYFRFTLNNWRPETATAMNMVCRLYSSLHN